MILFFILSLSIAFLSSATINSILGSSPPTSTTPDALSSTIQKPKGNSMSTFKITDEIKDRINTLLDSNRTNAAIEIGIVDRNGTQFYSTGKVSNTNNATVDQNTIFAIGSNTKVFTAILLADMVEEGLIELNDPIDKYLPPNVIVPQYKGHKITFEDLATHTSGLPEIPSNYCTSFLNISPQTTDEKVQLTLNYMKCTKDYTFDQFYDALSKTTISRESQGQNMNIRLLGQHCSVTY